MSKPEEQQSKRDAILHKILNKAIKKPFSSTVQFTCSPCNFICNNQPEYLAHLSTNEHKSKMVRIGLPNDSLHAKSEEEDTRKTFCAICNVNCCTPIQLKEHLNGKPHKARMLRKKYVANEDQNTTRNLMCSKDSTVAVNLVGPRQTPLITPILGPNEMRCDICHIVCSGRQPFLLHINGKQHKKALKKHQEAFPFWQQPEVEYPPPDYSHIVSYLTEEQSATDYSDRFDLSDEKLSQDKVEEKDIGKRIKII